MAPENKKTNLPSADAESNWIDLMDEREAKAGGFPVVGSRSVALQRIPTNFQDWAVIEGSIRPEVPKAFLRRLKDALVDGNLTAAMTTAWNAVLDDLRRKIVQFGLQHFSALEGMPVLKIPKDLETQVTSYNLLLGCSQLGLLNDEAYLHLSHCRDLMAGYTETARFASDVDRLDLLTFIKNCVKFCLAVDGPAPGFDIKTFMSSVEAEDLSERLTDFEAALRTQPPAVASTIVRLLFRRYTAGGDVETTAEANLLQIFPIAWAISDEEAKVALGQEFVAIRISGSNEQAGRAWNLLLLAGGVRYLPEVMLAKYFAHYSQALIDAHEGFNNFFNEPGPARDLRALGSHVPREARDLYVRAVVLCYLGNPYGISTAAQSDLTAMIDAFSADLVSRFFELLDRDMPLRGALMSTRPASRLKDLIARFTGRILPNYKETAETLQAKTPADLFALFSEAHSRTND